jgi:hypothetical protein
MRDEGQVKFKSELYDSLPPAEWDVEELNLWRDRLHALGYIGAYEDGVGYGNLSVKSRFSKEFIVTGTGTGKLPSLFSDHFVRVTDYSLEQNRVLCEGKVHASAETLTHAAVYACDPKAGAVIHIHSMPHWEKLLNRIPTTDPSAAYGTPEMAAEIARMFRATDFPRTRVMVMGGHEEGILAYDKMLQLAGERLLEVLRSVEG